MKWFSESVKTWNRKALFDAAWSGQSEILTQEMSKLLRKTISYHDYREDFYHAFLAGIFTGAGYVVESNKEHGEGRSDIVVYDSVNGQVAILRQNIPEHCLLWRATVKQPCAKLTGVCMQKSMKMNMTIFIAMV